MRTILPEAVCIAWNVGVAMPRGKLKGGHTTNQATSPQYSEVRTHLIILFSFAKHYNSRNKFHLEIRRKKWSISCKYNYYSIKLRIFRMALKML